MSVAVSMMTVRRAAAEDVAEVVLLERETGTAPHWGVGEYKGMLRRGAGRLRRALFVAVEGRALVGFAVGKIVGEGREAEAELESVVVRREGRRQGLGSALCRTVMDWSREEGAGVITLEVRLGSAGAVKLYEGLGFVVVGRRAGYYKEPVDDAVVMRCGLRGVGALQDEERGLF